MYAISCKIILTALKYCYYIILMLLLIYQSGYNGLEGGFLNCLINNNNNYFIKKKKKHFLV